MIRRPKYPLHRFRFRRLMFRRDWPFFYAFDVLSIESRDVRGLSLLARKRLLRSVMPRVESRLRYLDAVKERGTDLYRVACERDLEGIVAKWARGVYQADGRGTSWPKIKKSEYSQIVGRRDLFEQQRAPIRDTRVRNGTRSTITFCISCLPSDRRRSDSGSCSIQTHSPLPKPDASLPPLSP